MDEYDPEKMPDEKRLRGAPKKSGGPAAPEALAEQAPQVRAVIAEQAFVRSKSRQSGGADRQAEGTPESHDKTSTRTTPQRHGGATEPE